MFTAIVSALARVPDPRPVRLRIAAGPVAAQLQPGASISVNGACLTVVEVEGPLFYADVVPETLKRTNLGRLRPGDAVNLEPALTLAGRLDGHLVQGHVDATAEVRAVKEVELGRELSISLPGELAPYV